MPRIHAQDSNQIKSVLSSKATRDFMVTDKRGNKKHV